MKYKEGAGVEIKLTLFQKTLPSLIDLFLLIVIISTHAIRSCTEDRKTVIDFKKVMEMNMELRGFEAPINSTDRNKTSTTFEEPVTNPQNTLRNIHLNNTNK